MRHDSVITIQHSDASETYKDQFNALMTEVFGFSFSYWHKYGGWNQDYTCYSIIEEDEILSNVSVYKLNKLIRGQEKQILQFGAVATRRKYRGLGLSRQIFTYIFAQHAETPAFLCAHEAVTGFYQRLGFSNIRDRQPVIRVALSQRQGQIKKLSVEDPVVRKYLNERGYFSEILDCKNTAPINLFHLLHELRDSIYEASELQTLVIARQKGEILTLYDVVSR